MSTHVVPAPDRAPVTGVLRGEWTKLWSVRATRGCLAVALTLQGVVGASVGASFANGALDGAPAALPLARAGMAGIQVAQLALLGLALLAVTTEFSTGTITPSLQAVPRRARFVAAKVVVVGVVATVAGAVVVLVGGLTAWLGAGIYDHRGLGWILSGGGPAIDAAGLGRAVALGGLYVLLVSVLTIGLAVLLRSAVATLVTVLALLLVLPGILWELSIEWLVVVGEHLPGGAAAAVVGEGPYSTGRGVVVLAAWAVVAIAIGTDSLRRRDA